MPSEHEEWTDLFGETHTICNCKLCVYSRKVSSVIRGKNINELVGTISDLMDANFNIGADLEYLQAIMDGSWPSSAELLERALKKAKENSPSCG